MILGVQSSFVFVVVLDLGRLGWGESAWSWDSVAGVGKVHDYYLHVVSYPALVRTRPEVCVCPRRGQL